MTIFIIILLCLKLLHSSEKSSFQLAFWKSTKWDQDLNTLWHYKEGIFGGPSNWGHFAYTRNQWPACNSGKYQSPIDIRTESLIYDNNLDALEIIGYDSENYEIFNGGQDVHINLFKDSNLFFSSGPLSYDYKIFGMMVKFGSNSKQGSDHRLNNHSFPGEIEIYSYNNQLYRNFSDALTQPNGIAIVSVFLVISENSSSEISRLFSALEKVKYRGSRTQLFNLPLKSIIPSLQEYTTYHGSITYPGCFETVEWILLNRPIHVTETQLKSLRTLQMSEFDNRSSKMSDNFRLIQKVHRRPIRTNIKFQAKSNYCPINANIKYKTAIP